MATYHVAHSGGDSTSILGGLQLLGPGDTLDIHSDGDGRYIEAGIFNFGADGSKTVFEYGDNEGERITIQGAPGEAKPIFESTSTGRGAFRLQQTCRFLTIKDLIFDGKNQTATSEGHIKIFTQHGSDMNNIILDGLEIYNCASHGIFTDPWVNNSTFQNLIIWDVGRLDGQSNCIYADGGYNNVWQDLLLYYTAARTIVNHGGFRCYLNGGEIGVAGPSGGSVAVEGHDNVFQRIKAKGAQVNIVFGGNDNVLKNYLSINPTNTHVQLISPSQGTNDGHDIYNGTLYSASGAGKTGILVGSNVVGSGLNLANNGILGPATAINLNGVTPAQNATNLTSDPGFTDVASEDFHIASAGNWDETGTTVAAVTEDYDGLSRPQNVSYCVGAFEVPAPPESDPVNVLPATYSGVTDVELSLTGISVSDADDDLTGDADDNAGVWLRNDVGAVFSGTSTGTGTFQGEA